MSIFSREVARDENNNLAPQPYSTPRPLTAAAARVDVSNKKEIESLKKKREADDWQTQAWEFYDLVGELKYAANLIAAVTSRIKLYPAYITDNNLTPSHLQDIEDIDEKLINDSKRALRLLGSGNGGVPGLLRDAALNLFISGECWLVQTPANAFTKEAETWQIRSVDELVFTTGRNGGMRLKTRRDSKAGQQKEVPSKAFVGRIWNMHPRYSDEADSSVRGILELLDELLLLNKAARASIKSRLNAGILFFPDILTNASQSDGEITGEEGFADGSDDETDSFEEELLYAMTTPIADEGSAAAIVPLIIRGPESAADKIKHITLSRPFDDKHNERAEKVLDRILGALDIPKEVVAGIADSKYCVDEQTEALTRGGWKSYDQLLVGDEILTLNHSTGDSEWQPVKAVNVFETDNDEVVSLESRSHSSVTTLNHKWPVMKRKKGFTSDGRERRWTTSEDINTQHYLINSAPNLDLPTEKTYSDDFVELVGWYWTEGYTSQKIIDGKRGWSGVSQSLKVNAGNVQSINDALTAEYGEPRAALTRSEAALAGHQFSTFGDEPAWRTGLDLSGEQVYFLFNTELSQDIHRVCSGKDKIVSSDFIYSLTREQLELFIDTSIKADGHVNGEMRTIGQKNPRALDALELACILVGQPISRTTHLNGGKPWNTLTLKAADSVWPVRSSESKVIKTHTGHVWCPTTENMTWLARRRGTYYFTGNSNAVVIEETLYKSHIEPLALLLVDTFTTVFFKPVLRALGYKDDEIERVVLWYDPSSITTKPSKAEAADTGYNSHIISATAWRRAHGFSDTDGPTELETGQRLAVERGLLSEQVTEALLTTLMPKLMSSVREMTVNQSPGGQALHEAIGGTPIPTENQHDPIVEVPPGLLEPDEDTPAD